MPKITNKCKVCRKKPTTKECKCCGNLTCEKCGKVVFSYWICNKCEDVKSPYKK